MQAIETRYHGPTDTRGSRISARCEAGRISIPYDHAKSADRNHDAAAVELARKLGWLDSHAAKDYPVDLVRGGTARGFVYVFACGGNFGEIAWTNA